MSSSSIDTPTRTEAFPSVQARSRKKRRLRSIYFESNVETFDNSQHVGSMSQQNHIPKFLHGGHRVSQVKSRAARGIAVNYDAQVQARANQQQRKNVICVSNPTVTKGHKNPTICMPRASLSVQTNSCFMSHLLSLRFIYSGGGLPSLISYTISTLPSFHDLG